MALRSQTCREEQLPGGLCRLPYCSSSSGGQQRCHLCTRRALKYLMRPCTELKASAMLRCRPTLLLRQCCSRRERLPQHCFSAAAGLTWCFSAFDSLHICCPSILQAKWPQNLMIDGRRAKMQAAPTRTRWSFRAAPKPLPPPKAPGDGPQTGALGPLLARLPATLYTNAPCASLLTSSSSLSLSPSPAPFLWHVPCPT